MSTFSSGIRTTDDILTARIVRPVGVGEVWSPVPGFPAGWPCVPAFCFRLGRGEGDSGVAPRSAWEGEGCGEPLSGPA